MATRFQGAAVRAAAAGMAVILSGTTARGSELLLLDVLVSDGVGVSPEVAFGARSTAARIFERIGVRIVWLDTASARSRRQALDATAQRAFVTSLHIIRLVAYPPAEWPTGASIRSLGFAAPGTRVATVVYEHVARRAREAGGGNGMVLGHVIAHELATCCFSRPRIPLAV